MHFKPYFSDWAGQVNEYLASYLGKCQGQAKKEAPIAADLISDFTAFLGGGKRLRAGLVKLGYEIWGGKDRVKILPIAAAVEMIHGSLLIHDDIIDKGDMRHGKPTIHVKYAQNKTAHYGESMAILAGDFGLYEAIKLCLSADLPPLILQKVVQEILQIVLNTVYGEALDVEMAYQTQISEQQILTVNKLKTAYYTFIGPLTYGALAAGAHANSLKIIDKFALPLGIAYQIQDDILGIFGNEKTLGKSVDSDIKEGKNTLLYLEALKKGNAKQKNFLQKMWGNENITLEEVEEVRDIIRETAALDYAVKMAQELVAQSKQQIPHLTSDKNYQEILESLADYIVEREK
ncbi:polyprenyl synthetase family protein [Candidatus Microgenomates bacterium]|nr:polyprenyl synthetase family protein [Candidatus Microgenomates bacterium]